MKKIIRSISKRSKETSDPSDLSTPNHPSGSSLKSARDAGSLSGNDKERSSSRHQTFSGNTLTVPSSVPASTQAAMSPPPPYVATSTRTHRTSVPLAPGPTPYPVNSMPNSIWDPPRWTPSTSQSPNVAGPAENIDDTEFSFLRDFDTVFVIDDSGSMTIEGRWKEAEEAIATIAPICTQYDPDGIDLYFLHHTNPASPSRGWHNITSPSTVHEIFSGIQPYGGTPLAETLHWVLEPYLRRVEHMVKCMDQYGNLPDPTLAVRPMNIILVTDGDIRDNTDEVIARTAVRLDECHALSWQVGIQFFQIGNDPAATRGLQQLDDELAHIAKKSHMRDIVDTVPWKGASGQKLTGRGILKCVMGAVSKRYDRMEAH
jgi:hypothetical protein